MALSPARIDPKTLKGYFQHKDTNCHFEFADSDSVEFPHIIYVGPKAESTRYARILKTVAYVLVDEEIVEKWSIKNHKIYSK